MTAAPESRSAPFIAPFLVYVGMMAVEKYLPFPPFALYTMRLLVVAAVLLTISRPVISFRLVSPLLSVVMGFAVFVIWIGPDLVIDNYRDYWLFRNPVTGAANSSLPEDLKLNPLFLAIRSLGSFVLVPILEELFWRAWMMRWLIDNQFGRVPLGTYTALSFWVVAALFALEHGPYWEVGLLAGIAYNWWMVKTKSLGDCILAHAVTNAVLAAFVIARGQWQYWL